MTIAEVAHLKNYPAKTLDVRTLTGLRDNMAKWQADIDDLIRRHPTLNLAEEFKAVIDEVAEARQQVDDALAALKESPA